MNVRVSDPDTSHTAAEAHPEHRQTMRRQVLDTLYLIGPMTDFELAAELGSQQTSVGKRRGELADRGLVEDSGDREPSPSGSPAIVWRITEEGRNVAWRIKTRREFDSDRELVDAPATPRSKKVVVGTLWKVGGTSENGLALQDVKFVAHGIEGTTEKSKRIFVPYAAISQFIYGDEA